MNNLFLFLLLVSLVCLVIGLIKPSVFSRVFKGDVKRGKIFLIFSISTIVFFILFGATSGNVNNQEPKNEVANKKEQVLAQHKVILGDIQGTTRKIYVIVQTGINKDELIAINDDLIKNYSNKLTHLNIEYFDDEAISQDYFQRISQVSDEDGDELFKHYIGTYTMNKTTGHNKLNFNENNDWVTVKQY